MDTVYTFLRLIKKRLLAAYDQFNGMSFKQKKDLCWQWIKEHVFASVLISGIIIALSGCILMPPQARIIPMGPEMKKAFDLLGTTNTGREIIRKVKKSAKGPPIFLTLGSTSANDLMDYNGDTVVGATRAFFKNIENVYLPNGVFIYSNKDVTNSRPDYIALNIAFELENVVYVMKNPGAESGDDSPAAWNTLEKVARELGLMK
jgi:hypothetical protein